ncbi:MAG: hypothetical protein HFH62_12240 [Lachnospiraceae bacterium]|nr:hypothetical protein [Lachnospiraceae bacterium]
MLDLKDMTELLYIHDAFDKLNTILLGTELLVCTDEGILGAFSRIHAVIERNISTTFKESDCQDIWKVADNTSLTPEQRAKILLEDAR